MSYSSIKPDKPRTPDIRHARPSLAIVVPCYNEEQILDTLFARLGALGDRLIKAGKISAPLDLVLVDDGSSDATWDMIQTASCDARLTGVRLSRNQGHQNALLAGLHHSEADITVTMDADLQDDPDAIEAMIDAYQDGAEIVFGVRASRACDTAFKRATALGYYRLLSVLGVDIIPNHADYRLMGRKALHALNQFSERNLFLRGVIPQLGFRVETVTYDRAPRTAGESKYPLGKMLALAIEGITSFSVRPLRMITLIGFVVAGLSLVLAVRALLAWMTEDTVPGWSSIIISIYFLGGLHLIALGVIGEYVGKIYKETKGRPRFIVDEVTLKQPRMETFEPLQVVRAE